jgi:RNA polymerase sigma factor (sigma-70 family)
MARVKVDIHKLARRLEERYDYTVDGVKNFLKDLGKLQTQRITNIEITLLCIDFEQAVEMAELSDRERETLYQRYILRYTQKHVAKSLGITRRSVQIYEKRGIQKLVDALTGSDANV